VAEGEEQREQQRYEDDTTMVRTIFSPRLV
jgi:hypothetical protein